MPNFDPTSKEKRNWGGNWGAIVTPEYPEGAAVRNATASMWQGHKYSGGVLKLKSQFDAKTELRTNPYLLKLVADRKKQQEITKALAAGEAESDKESDDENVSEKKKTKLKYIKKRDSEGSWACPKCGNMNWAVRESCNSRMCDMKNPNPQAIRATQSERDKAASAKETAKKNQLEIERCAAEGKPPPQQLSRNQKRKLVKKRKMEEQRQSGGDQGW
jgi:hypothetical protein